MTSPQPASCSQSGQEPDADDAQPRGRLAFVANRFGDDVAGGAEMVIGELGRGLHGRGWQVDIITSSARDLYTWKNELPEGESVEHGLRVLRFETMQPTKARERNRIGNQIAAGATVSLTDQYRWMNYGVRVPGMHEYLVDHASRYRAILMAPYLFWTTFACAEIAPERTILHPCLHDEPEARLDIFKPMFESSRGILFQTGPEQDLGRRLFNLSSRTALVGSGIDPPAGYDAEGFRRRHGIEGDFILFAGRREWGKGWPELLRSLDFANSQLPHRLPLVTCGVGDIGPVPPNAKIVDLGYLSESERSNAMAAATIYVQPSAMESFSRTIMEAWLAGTVVMANAASAVVGWHCRRSGGGLAYRDRYEFTEALRLLLDRPDTRAAMAGRGRDYVLRNYRWPDVLGRVERVIEEWT
jgi:glycosyltransferase involved in cell wall biosynthesis